LLISAAVIVVVVDISNILKYDIYLLFCLKL
jgi:hypothetical protein